MTVGTKSVLFGAHQFMIHPWFVAWGWWMLFGFPWDPRLWLVFFVHDLGYLGKPNMDGVEGEGHIWAGARIMGVFDDNVLRRGWRRWSDPMRVALNLVFGVRGPRGDEKWIGYGWYCLSFYHSRFIAKRYEVPVSQLCYADKLAIALTPAWLYLPMVRATGEIHEYMERATARGDCGLDPRGLPSIEQKYVGMADPASGQAEWYRTVQSYLRTWVEEHVDGTADEREELS